MNEYNFSKFQDTGGRYETRISITSNRSIGFPTRFYEENKLVNFKFVMLFFDQAKKAIGIQFTKDESEPHKFTLIKSKLGYGGSIVATSFFKKYKIDIVQHKGKYDWRKVKTEFGNLFVLELKSK